MTKCLFSINEYGVSWGGGVMTHGMFVPRNYDAGILTFGLRGVAFDAGPLTRVNLTQGDF